MTVPYLDGLLAQPDNLGQSAAIVSAALDDTAGQTAVATLAGGRVVALGMGASTAAALGFAAALRRVGRAVLAASASDLVEGVPDGLADAYLAISQSGRSAETVAAMELVSDGARVALTNDAQSPLAAHADSVLPLGCGPDTRVSTLSYTATLQALGLLADRLTSRRWAHWPELPDAVGAALGEDPEPIASAFAAVGSIDVVGAGVSVASAAAAGLLLREAAHLPTASYTTREYLHGPLETAGPGRGALIFGAGRELNLAVDLAGYGTQVVLVTATAADLPGHRNLCVVRRPPLPGLAGCVMEIVPVQLAAYALAERQGLAIELRHMPDDTKVPSS